MANITVKQIREDINILLGSTVIYHSEEHGRSEIIGVLKLPKYLGFIHTERLYLQCVGVKGEKFKTVLPNDHQLEIR